MQGHVLIPEPVTGHRNRIPWITLTSGSQSVAPRPAAAALPENLLEMQILGPHPRATEPETLGVDLSKLFFLNCILLASVITML